jgi:DNA-directed RNA polymerase sigma subunit (sigma70/sigma32)
VANLTRERVRQLEDLTLAKLREACAEFPALAEYLKGGV